MPSHFTVEETDSLKGISNLPKVKSAKRRVREGGRREEKGTSGKRNDLVKVSKPESTGHGRTKESSFTGVEVMKARWQTSLQG